MMMMGHKRIRQLALRQGHEQSLNRGYGGIWARLMGALCYLLGPMGISQRVHRWNPHADVAELVDALVSGSPD